MIKTSVIIPVYNTEAYISECLDSVLRQTQKDVEIIVVDDGSTDNSLEIVRKYQKTYSNVNVICQENKKLGAARNLGISIATGKYLCFLDADDFIEESMLEELYQKAKDNVLDFVTFDLNCFGGSEEDNLKYQFYDRSKLGIKDRIYSGVQFWNDFFKFQDPVISACSVYFDRNFINENKLRFQENLFYEDNEFMIKAYLKANKLMYIPKQYYCRRIRQGSIMTTALGFYHFKGILSNIRLIFQHIKGDNHDIAQKEVFLKFWEAQVRKACRLWISFEGKEKQQLSDLIGMCLKDMCSGTFLIDILDKALYIDLKEFLEHIRLDEYNIDSCTILEETLNVWYEDNIELFQRGYSKKYLNALKNKDGVILYGAGIIGQRVANHFQLKYWENVIGFAVSDKNNTEENICGLPVFSISELLDFREKANVFITTSPNIHKEIETNLLQKGFKNIYPLDWKRLLESVWM